jgi:hypothetical protein
LWALPFLLIDDPGMAFIGGKKDDSSKVIEKGKDLEIVLDSLNRTVAENRKLKAEIIAAKEEVKNVL